MHRVTLYTRLGCHLCEEAKEVIERVRATQPFEFGTVDIDGDPELVALYGLEIPVIAINGRRAFKYRVDEGALRARLLRA
ncbi:MAG: glutaredoxin family protein [Polyangiales bacterium]